VGVFCVYVVYRDFMVPTVFEHDFEGSHLSIHELACSVDSSLEFLPCDGLYISHIYDSCCSLGTGIWEKNA